MSQAIPTSVAVAEDDAQPHARATIVASRLMLGANTTLQLTILFAYLYLRANNFGGMWRPSAVGQPALAIAVSVLLPPVLTIAVLTAALSIAGRASARAAFSVVFSAALLVGMAAVAIRVYQLYNTGWNLNQGGYVDISVFWFAVLLAEFIIGCLWMLSMLSGHLRKTVSVSRSQVLSVLEFWTFVTVVALGVYALVQYLN